MGIAILSGVIASMESSVKPIASNKWESHTPGTQTPTGAPVHTLPGRFIACVNRRETAAKLQVTFSTLGHPVEVVAGQNVKAVQEADVVILWLADLETCIGCNLIFELQLQAAGGAFDTK